VVVVAGCGPRRSRDAAVTASGRPYFGDVTPPARDVFTFDLGAEPESFDPGLAVGQPDGRVCRLMFEGLAREDPRTLEPTPGQAYRWDVSADGRIYTFHLRPGLQWSDGRPLTAEDFRWSWIRVLRPETASRYANLLACVEGAGAFTAGRLTDERAVGIAATDDSTLVVRLVAPTAYFLHLTQFYTLLPVPRPAIERWGNRWTRPEHVVGNGAFLLERWRQNDRFEFVRNPRYWDAAGVKLDGVVALSLDEMNTATNLYKAGAMDWQPSGYLPSAFIPYLRNYADFTHGGFQGVYYYSLNVTRKPLDDPWVRRALNYAIDRDAIARDLLKGSRDPWGNMTPTGYPGYHAPPPVHFDPQRARECLAHAGYPGGRGFPHVAILISTSEDLRRIAEAVQAMWKRELGITIEIANQEWGSYLQATTSLQYDVASRSWIGDYLDPNTFLACFVSGDGNNRTGWSDPAYDRLIRDAAAELDPARRFALLAQAEQILLDSGPVIPIYHMATNEMIKPYVRGLYPTPLNVHPLTHVWIDRDWRARTTQVAHSHTPPTAAGTGR
jgi:ABC-type oligopeptide transport system substrate-binding subunit